MLKLQEKNSNNKPGPSNPPENLDDDDLDVSEDEDGKRNT